MKAEAESASPTTEKHSPLLFARLEERVEQLWLLRYVAHCWIFCKRRKSKERYMYDIERSIRLYNIYVIRASFQIPSHTFRMYVCLLSDALSDMHPWFKQPRPQQPLERRPRYEISNTTIDVQDIM